MLDKLITILNTMDFTQIEKEYGTNTHCAVRCYRQGAIYRIALFISSFTGKHTFLAERSANKMLYCDSKLIQELQEQYAQLS